MIKIQRDMKSERATYLQGQSPVIFMDLGITKQRGIFKGINDFPTVQLRKLVILVI